MRIDHTLANMFAIGDLHQQMQQKAYRTYL